MPTMFLNETFIKAQVLWRRFERVFHLAIAEYAQPGGSTTSAPSDTVVSAEAKPRTRRKLGAPMLNDSPFIRSLFSLVPCQMSAITRQF
jgi:hypothetical protein